MELLIMLAVGAGVLGLIWLIVREPKDVQLERERRVEDFRERWKQRELEEQQAARIVQPLVNAAIPRAYPAMPPVKKPKPEKHVDTPKAKAYSGSSSGSSSRSSSRSDDDSWTSTSSYSSWGGDSGSSSSSSSCDSSSSSSSSSSCD